MGIEVLFSEVVYVCFWFVIIFIFSDVDYIIFIEEEFIEFVVLLDKILEEYFE